MIPRPDFLDSRSPAGIEVFQLTADTSVPACHVYMEAPVFAPDSSRFVLHESADAHHVRKDEPRHRYLLCDLEDHGRLTPLTEETGVTSPCVSPDGHYLYYFHDQTETGGGRLTLKRVGLDGTGRETIRVLDQPIPGTRFRPSRIYSLATIRSDGGAIALSAFLGDGRTENAPFGVMVFDVRTGEVSLPLVGTQYGNAHPQYSRSPDENAMHDLFVQDNADNIIHGPDGRVVDYRRTLGVCIRVARDDGTRLRSMPWGGPGERIQGHTCWRGRSGWGLCSFNDLPLDPDFMTNRSYKIAPDRQHMIESLPVDDPSNRLAEAAGAVRNLLTRDQPHPRFWHFGTDLAGNRLISDYGDPYGLWDGRTELVLAELGEPGKDPFHRVTRLLDSRTSSRSERQAHPFLSPDGRTAFFNSDESGILQAYMVRGLDAVFPPSERP